jgi:hypothetical protein
MEKNIVNTSSYFIGKLFDINYSIAIHEGNAKQRLYSVVPRIKYQLMETEVPKRFEKEFHSLMVLINNSSKKDPVERRQLRTLRSIQNVTAAKFIKMLLDMQYYLENK